MGWNQQIASRTIWQEARGEAEQGQRAIAHVLLNRLRDGRWGVALASVCLWPYQFSGWNQNDPNRLKSANLDDADPLLVKFQTFIQDAFNGEEDMTFGATHYYADTIKPPAWIQGATFCVKIGRHVFYKDVK